MNSCASLQRNSFSDMQPFCWIMSGAHSVFQTRTALSVSDGSILMWMRRMMDMAFLLRGDNDRESRKTQDAQLTSRARASPVGTLSAWDRSDTTCLPK